MKTTTLICSLALALVACGSTEDENQLPAPPTTEPPKPEENAPKRTLVDSKAMGTRTDNLVIDPTYGSAEHIYKNALFATEDVTLRVETPATSPAGIAQNVLVAKGTGFQPSVLLAVQGGTGPLDASMFISVGEGRPAPSVTLTSMDGTQAYELKAASKTETHGDKTYKLYSARIEQPAYGKLYFIVEPGMDAVTIAKPEVVAGDPKKPQMKAQAIALSPSARNAVRAFASRPIVDPPPNKRGANGLQTKLERLQR